MDMKCVAYDPFITKERAAQLGVEMMSVEDLFKIADVITVHTPLIAETKHLINAKEYCDHERRGADHQLCPWWYH